MRLTQRAFEALRPGGGEWVRGCYGWVWGHNTPLLGASVQPVLALCAMLTLPGRRALASAQTDELLDDE